MDTGHWISHVGVSVIVSNFQRSKLNFITVEDLKTR